MIHNSNAQLHRFNLKHSFLVSSRDRSTNYKMIGTCSLAVAVMAVAAVTSAVKAVREQFHFVDC